MRTIEWNSRQGLGYVALGDSFTEGLEDELRADGRHRGWADRVAQQLADHAGDVRYANLAVRGRLLPQVVEEQVPAAIALKPDLVTLAAGVNDALRPGFDVDLLATSLERGVRSLRATGATVVIFAFGDPARRSRVMGSIRERIRVMNTAVHAIADEYDCGVVDFWGMAVFDDDRLWNADRLHLSPRGHRLAAQSVLEVLGHADDSWRTPAELGAPGSVLSRGGGHLRWVGSHAAPWVMRRLRGESSGDSITPKHPDWVAVHRTGQASTG